MIRRKILLVGNGPCVLDSDRGHEIDDFEGKIVRFNGYEIEGYEKYVGTRTDILALGMLSITEQLKLEYDYILLYQSGLDGGAGLRKVKKLSPHNEVIFFPLHAKDKIKELLELPRKIEPTTGVITVYWFTRPDVELYLYGFDFFERGGEYFNKKIIPADIRCHNPGTEKVYVEYLIEQNLIRRF